MTKLPAYRTVRDVETAEAFCVALANSGRTIAQQLREMHKVVHCHGLVSRMDDTTGADANRLASHFGGVYMERMIAELEMLA